MKWWIKAIITTIIVSVLCLAVGIITTDVILKDTITPEYDEKISEITGQVIGILIVAVWVITYLAQKKAPRKSPE
jgi:H+/gluconate symporter-like permease